MLKKMQGVLGGPPPAEAWMGQFNGIVGSPPRGAALYASASSIQP
jgi:hypothetical protein